MSDVSNIVRASMQADAEAVRLIGQNVANAGVTAYQRQIPVSSSTFSDALGAAGLEAVGAQETTTQVAFDAQTGTLRSTGEPLHVALEGTGFFLLQDAGGVQLTRRGDFHVSAEGLLTSATGKTVLGEHGAIDVGAAIPVIDADGTVRIGTGVLDRLRVVQVGDRGRLTYVGDAAFVAPSDALADADAATVRQGFLETSNVTPVGEMVQLMETVRHFEASQRLVRGYDEMLQKAISELGKVG